MAARFGKSKYSAEAEYRIGLIYQVKLDSLEAAKTYYDEVPRQYAGSEYAGDAIKRSSNISTLLKLRESVDEDDPAAKALREFSLAEVQLFQFEDAAKAKAEYEKVLAEFPHSEYAPKAAYAIGYIYETMLGDSLKALEAFKYLIVNYPESQQAAYARKFLVHAAGDSLSWPERVVWPESIAKPDSLVIKPDSAVTKPDSTAVADSVRTGTGGSSSDGRKKKEE